MNLVDFDMIYGHRNDIEGYAKALSEFDTFLPEIRGRMKEDDLLIITADHGCDPGTPSTDHSREYVPLLISGEHVRKIMIWESEIHLQMWLQLCYTILVCRASWKGLPCGRKLRRKTEIETMSELTKDMKEQIKRRRTFAIISHPDAGKTTLTEKFLLYGGAINQAGSVKGKATAKHAVSDWMEIEKRGESQLLHPFCSLSTTVTVSIFWILRGTRISRRIPTVH